MCNGDTFVAPPAQDVELLQIELCPVLFGGEHVLPLLFPLGVALDYLRGVWGDGLWRVGKEPVLCVSLAALVFG